MCVINRECKVLPIHSFYKQFGDEPITQYVGIASDEKKRMARLKSNQISLLDKYGYTEKMAMEKCKEYNLVSPLYLMSCRGGVGSAPTANILHFRDSGKHIQSYGVNWKYSLTLPIYVHTDLSTVKPFNR